MFDKKVKKIYIHRDGRDVVASSITAYSLSDAYKKKDLVDWWHEGTPAYYRCKRDDMRYSLVQIFSKANLWLHHILGFFQNKASYLEVRFADITYDNPNFNKTIRKVIEDILQFLRYEHIEIDSILQKMDLLDNVQVSYRKGYKKIGAYKELFERSELEAITNFLSFGLEIMGYAKDKELHDFLYKKSITLLIDHQEQSDLTKRLIALVVKYYRINIEKKIVFDEFEAIRHTLEANKNYLLFSRKKIDTKRYFNIRYFTMYKFFTEYTPSFFDIYNKKRVLIDALQNTIVVYDDEAFLQNVLEVFLQNRTISYSVISIEDEKLSESINKHDKVLCCCVKNLQSNYTALLKLHRLIDKNKKLYNIYPTYDLDIKVSDG